MVELNQVRDVIVIGFRIIPAILMVGVPKSAKEPLAQRSVLIAIFGTHRENPSNRGIIARAGN